MAETLISIDGLHSETIRLKTKRRDDPAGRHELRVMRIEEFVLAQGVGKS